MKQFIITACHPDRAGFNLTPHQFIIRSRI